MTILMAVHYFVRQLLSSALWPFITRLAIRLSHTQINFFSCLSTCFIYKFWLFLLKTRLFWALDWILRGDWALALLMERSSFIPASIFVDERKARGLITFSWTVCRDGMQFWLTFPAHIKSLFPFRFKHKTDGFMCRVDWFSFYRRVLIYWNFV